MIKDQKQSVHLFLVKRNSSVNYSNNVVLAHVTSFCDKLNHLLYKDFRYKSDFPAHQQGLNSFFFFFFFFFYSGLMTPGVKMNKGKSQRVTHILVLVEWYARHP